MFSCKNYVFFCEHIIYRTLPGDYLWENSFFNMFYSLKNVIRYNKIIPEGHDKKLATQSWIFDHQADFIKASIFMNVIKNVEIGFSSLYHKRLSKIYSDEKVRSLGIGEEFL